MGVSSLSVNFSNPYRSIKRAPQVSVTIGLLLALLVMFAVNAGRLLPACQAEAAPSISHGLSDFCYRTQLDVLNSTGGVLTNYPVAAVLNVNALVNQDKLSDAGWDFKPVNPGFSEVPGFIQDVETDANSTVFLSVSAASGVTVSYQMYTGSADYKRDQGMYFESTNSGADSATVADHADFDLTDTFEIIVDAETATADQDGGLVDKYDAGSNSGYSLDVTSTGSGKIRARVGNGAATTSLEVDWGGDELVRSIFDSALTNDLAIYFGDGSGGWTLQDETNTGYASIAANATAITIAGSYDGEIREIQINDNLNDPSYAKVSQWSFNADELSQTQEGTSGNSWQWLGTIEDVTASHDATYDLTNTQTNITRTLRATAFNFSDPASQASDTTADFLGSVGTTDFSASGTAWQDFGLLGEALTLAVGGTSLSTTAFKFALTLMVALALAILGFWFTKNEDLFALLVIIIISVSAIVQFIPPWWAVISGFMVFAGWMTVRRVTI